VIEPLRAFRELDITYCIVILYLSLSRLSRWLHAWLLRTTSVQFMKYAFAAILPLLTVSMGVNRAYIRRQCQNRHWQIELLLCLTF